MAETLPILYLDEHIAVIDKPAGLLVHRSDIDRRETQFAVQILRDQLGRRVWPAHRLDRGTSGVLVFGLSAEIASRLGQQFMAGGIGKRYWAVVRGHPPESGEINHPLTRQADRYDVDSADEPQSALTRFRRLAVAELPVAIDRYPRSRYALLELDPVTGRRHQLRRHLKHISHPIIGDSTYGKGKHNRYFAEHFNCPRLLLACVEMSFLHPTEDRRLSVHAPVSGQFASLLAALGWSPRSAENAQ